MTSPYTDRSERSSLLPWSTFCFHARRERAIRLRMAGVQLEGAGYASGTKLFLLPRAADGHDKGDEGKRSRRVVGAAIPWPPPGPGARGRFPRESSGPATTRRAFERPPRGGSRRPFPAGAEGESRSAIGRVPAPLQGRRCRCHEDAGSVVDRDSAVRLSRWWITAGKVEQPSRKYQKNRSGNPDKNERAETRQSRRAVKVAGGGRANRHNAGR